MPVKIGRIGLDRDSLEAKKAGIIAKSVPYPADKKPYEP